MNPDERSGDDGLDDQQEGVHGRLSYVVAGI
jgi:hypothetical protein